MSDKERASQRALKPYVVYPVCGRRATKAITENAQKITQQKHIKERGEITK